MPPKLEPSNQVRIKEFWPSDVETWFVSVEFSFAKAGITNELLKFQTIGEVLPLDIMQGFSDILRSPPAEEPYTKLKTLLIKRKSISEEGRLQQLLAHEQLGDILPSDMLRSVRRLLGDRALARTLLETLFLQRLPSAMRSILAPMEKSADLTELAEAADRIQQAQTLPPVHIVVPGPSRQYGWTDSSAWYGPRPAPHFGSQDARYFNVPGPSRQRAPARDHIRIPDVYTCTTPRARSAISRMNCLTRDKNFRG